MNSRQRINGLLAHGAADFFGCYLDALAPSGKCFATRYRMNGVTDYPSLNLRYPLFAGTVNVHLWVRLIVGG